MEVPPEAFRLTPTTIPATDGQVATYQVLSPVKDTPRIYYINGIQTSGITHAKTAMLLSAITERRIVGIYNATAGSAEAGWLLDFLQCIADWLDVFPAKLVEMGNAGINHLINKVNNTVQGRLGRLRGNPVNVAEALRRRVPLNLRVALIERAVSLYNPATASLFRELSRRLTEQQWVIAHSQGNLIAADALWSLSAAFGEASLAQMQVFSLASPAPAWPMGIRGRHKVYGYSNDLVTLFDPHNWDWITKNLAGGRYRRMEGSWRQFGVSAIPDTSGHGVEHNIAINFVKTIRKMLATTSVAPQ
jgi:hypothetical protein